MKYTPSDGRFAGQGSYGYRSFELFIAAAQQVTSGLASPRDFDSSLATIHSTFLTTAILHAGRMSLDADGAAIEICYPEGGPASHHPCALKRL